MDLQRKLQELKASFAKRHIVVSEQWLLESLHLIKQALPVDFENEAKVAAMIYSMWLALDLRSVKRATLPANLHETLQCTLTQSVVLQLLHVTDISKSKYSQLRSLGAKAMSNQLIDVEDEEMDGSESKHTEGSGRMLKLHFTDGVQEISGIELMNIPRLRLNLPPGTKILLLSPIRIQRGTILLYPGRVLILGGRVLQLATENRVETVLSRALNLPPKINHVITRPNAVAANPARDERDFDDIIDDDFIDNQFREVKNEQETAMREVESKPRVEQQREWKEFEDEEDFNEFLMDCGRNEARPMSINPPRTETLPTPSTSGLQAAKRSPPILTVAKLLELQPNVSKGNFVVKARFRNIASKLNVVDNEYEFKITLGDNTGRIEAWVHPKIVTELLNLDAATFKAYSDGYKANDPDAKMAFLNVGSSFAGTLTLLHAKFMIAIEATKEPVVIEIVERLEFYAP